LGASPFWLLRLLRLGIASKRGVDPQAIGAAREMALGAMYAGASGEEAVRRCIERRDAAGGEAFVGRLGK
jgi:hypothetical protein